MPEQTNPLSAQPFYATRLSPFRSIFYFVENSLRRWKNRARILTRIPHQIKGLARVWGGSGILGSKPSTGGASVSQFLPTGSASTASLDLPDQVSDQGQVNRQQRDFARAWMPGEFIEFHWQE